MKNLSHFARLQSTLEGTIIHISLLYKVYWLLIQLVKCSNSRILWSTLVWMHGLLIQSPMNWGRQVFCPIHIQFTVVKQQHDKANKCYHLKRQRLFRGQSSRNSEIALGDYSQILYSKDGKCLSLGSIPIPKKVCSFCYLCMSALWDISFFMCSFATSKESIGKFAL